MRTSFLAILVVFCLDFTSCKSQTTFNAFDFLPTSTKEAEANGFSKVNPDSLRNVPIQNQLNVSSLYQMQKNDTIVRLFFADEKLIARTFGFPFRSFDSSELFVNLKKSGELILHGTADDRGLIGAFKKGSDVYHVFKTPESIGLINRLGVDKATRPTGPIIEQRRTQ